MILTTLKAGVVALALAGTALAAVPAQAASPIFGFSLNLGGGGSNGGIILHFGDDNYWDVCYTNKQIIKGLNNSGYSQVKIVKEYNSSNKVWAIGKRHGDWWQLRVDRCTGKVDRIKKIYPKGSTNSFNLTFTF